MRLWPNSFLEKRKRESIMTDRGKQCVNSNWVVLCLLSQMLAAECVATSIQAKPRLFRHITYHVLQSCCCLCIYLRFPPCGSCRCWVRTCWPSSRCTNTGAFPSPLCATLPARCSLAWTTCTGLFIWHAVQGVKDRQRMRQCKVTMCIE